MGYLVPNVLKREGNSERAMDIYSRLLEDRIVHVTGEINSDMAAIVKAQLQFLESEDPEQDIVMYIDSPGGEVYAGLSIYDTMQYVAPDVCTVVSGMAMSMGSILLAGGTKGKRYSLLHSRIMIHQPSSGAKGKLSDMRIAYEEGEALKEITEKLMSDLTGKPYEKVVADMDRDNFMSPKEALEYGIIDRILVSRGDMKA